MTSITVSVLDGASYSGAGGETMIAGNNDTISLSGGGNNITGLDHNVMTIYGGSNSVTLQDYNLLTINDSRSEANGFAGTINFGDSISLHTNDTVSLNYTLNLGSSDKVSIGFQPSVTENGVLTSLLGLGQSGDTVNSKYVVNAGAGDTISFSGSNQAVLLSVGKGDTILTTGTNDTITIGGSSTTKSSMTIAGTASGTTVNGGLGTDTFTAGSGYDGGNHFVASARSNTEGFNTVGSCANYSSLSDRVTVNLNAGAGQGFDANGNQLWTDTYTNIQQVKAGQLDGNVLTGSDAFYCELKAGIGSTTYYGGAAGDRIIWGSAGNSGLLDGKGTDIAYGGAGADEFYWRNSPGGKGVSNFGETIYGFNPSQGDDLNLSEFADSGFAGVANAFNGTDNNPFSWADVSLSANGQDTDIWFDKSGSGNFTQLAAVLKNENLFAAYGVSDTSSVGAHQVIQDLYNGGGLVLVQPH